MDNWKLSTPVPQLFFRVRTLGTLPKKRLAGILRTADQPIPPHIGPALCRCESRKSEQDPLDRIRHFFSQKCVVIAFLRGAKTGV